MSLKGWKQFCLLWLVYVQWKDRACINTQVFTGHCLWKCVCFYESFYLDKTGQQSLTTWLIGNVRRQFNSELDEKQRKRFPPTENGTCFLNKGFKSNKLFIKNLLKDSNFRWWVLGWPSWTVLCSQIIKFQFHISCNPTFHPCLWPVIVLQLVSQNC